MKLSLPIKTDQHLCYDTEGREISCAGTGQDGEVDAGREWPAPRFEVHDGSVTDRLTGHVWCRNDNLPEFPLTWAEGKAHVDQMNREKVLGRSDWQLPGRAALFSLVSHARVNPALPAEHPFTRVFTGYYWTGVAVARLPSQAWYVHLGGGRVFKGMKHGSYMVWPVAESSTAGSAGEARVEETDRPESRFLVSGPTVLDRSTGLEWTRSARLEHPVTDWGAALEAVREMNARKPFGVFDWRMPNVRELESLVCLTAHSPALPPGHPFEDVGMSYWTSTTSAYEPTYAWVLHMEDGAVGVGFKRNPGFSVWPVRTISTERRWE